MSVTYLEMAGSTAATVSAKPARRIIGLDALRGLAAAAVVLYHYTSNYQRVFHHTTPSLFSMPLGALGVQLFFLISGFVIFMTLQRTERSRDFVRSRFSRLFPTYWAAILLTFVIMHLFPIMRAPSVGRAVANLTMVQELFGVGDVDAVYWTLRIELCFYVIMLALFAAGQLRRAEGWLLGLIGINVLRRLFLDGHSPLMQHHQHIASAVGMMRTILVLDQLPAFLIGITLFKSRQGMRWWHAGLLALCLLDIFFHAPHVDFWFTILFTAAVYAAAQGWLDTILSAPPLLFLGFISYSLYLTHQNIGYIIIWRLEAHGWSANAAICVAIMVALGIGTSTTLLIEQPALRLLRGRRPAGQRPSSTALP